MSLHKSLKRKDHLTRRRNVLTRAERLERLKKDERWDEEKDSVFGLAKVQPEVIVAPTARPRAAEKVEEAEGEAAEAAPEK